MAKKKKKKESSQKIADAVIKGIQEKKGKNIVCLDLREIQSAVADFFIICEGDSNVQIEAITQSVEEMVKKETGEKPWHSEGKQVAEWILIDYFNVVVHVFQKEVREFYNLEALWADAEIKKVA
jgi:ribosome-associated protein